jgi:hypothetical protein
MIIYVSKSENRASTWSHLSAVLIAENPWDKAKCLVNALGSPEQGYIMGPCYSESLGSTYPIEVDILNGYG